MSTDFYVKGYRSPEDPEHQKHVKVAKVCEEAGVSLPEETALYFDRSTAKGIDFDGVLEMEIPFTQDLITEGLHAYEVLLSDLPPGVHKIKFLTSW